jgi:hypothetical protein
LKKKITKNIGEVAQGVGPEFKPQYQKKKNVDLIAFNKKPHTEHLTQCLAHEKLLGKRGRRILSSQMPRTLQVSTSWN